MSASMEVTEEVHIVEYFVPSPHAVKRPQEPLSAPNLPFSSLLPQTWSFGRTAKH